MLARVRAVEMGQNNVLVMIVVVVWATVTVVVDST